MNNCRDAYVIDLNERMKFVIVNFQALSHTYAYAFTLVTSFGMSTKKPRPTRAYRAQIIPIDFSHFWSIFLSE